MANAGDQGYPCPNDRHHDYHDEHATRGLTAGIPFGYRIDASPALKPGFFFGVQEVAKPEPDMRSRPMPTCRNCTVPMEPGFQIDYGHGVIVQSRWVPGEQSPTTFWSTREATREQTKEALRVVSYRCPECGLLDCYANEPVKTQ